MSLFALLPALSRAPEITLVSLLTTCPPAAAPQVATSFVNTPPQVTHTLDHAALGQFSTSTTFSHHKKEVFLTGGITESNIKTNYNLTFSQVIDPNTKTACLSVDKVEVTVSYDPVVHIASNFPAGSCRFTTTWQHELLHVNTDLITLKERLPQLEGAVRQAAQQLTVIGPFDVAQMPAHQQSLVDYIGKVVSTSFADIDKLRLQRQQTIDTREEYLRLSKACPQQPMRR